MLVQYLTFITLTYNCTICYAPSLTNDTQTVPMGSLTKKTMYEDYILIHVLDV